MTRSMFVAASLLTAGLAYAGPTPAQLGQIKHFVNQDAKTYAAAKGKFKAPTFHAHTTSTKAGNFKVTGTIHSMELSWPFPNKDGSFEGPRETAVRYYSAKVQGGVLKIKPAGAWQLGSGQVVK